MSNVVDWTIIQSLSSTNSPIQKLPEERTLLSTKPIIDNSDSGPGAVGSESDSDSDSDSDFVGSIGVFNVWYPDSFYAGDIDSDEKSVIYLARDGNQPPEHRTTTLEDQGELNPGQTLVISTTTDRPYSHPTSGDDPEYTGKEIQIVDGEPDMSDERLFPPRVDEQRMVYESISYGWAVYLLLNTDPVADGVVKVEE